MRLPWRQGASVNGMLDVYGKRPTGDTWWKMIVLEWIWRHHASLLYRGRAIIMIWDGEMAWNRSTSVWRMWERFQSAKIVLGIIRTLSFWCFLSIKVRFYELLWMRWWIFASHYRVARQHRVLMTPSGVCLSRQSIFDVWENIIGQNIAELNGFLFL